MPEWYKTHSASPECYSEAEYRDWAQDNGLYVDAAGNVDYGPPEQGCGDCGPQEPVRDGDRYHVIPDEDLVVAKDTATGGGLDTWDF